jgi:hypothetical protein
MPLPFTFIQQAPCRLRFPLDHLVLGGDELLFSGFGDLAPYPPDPTEQHCRQHYAHDNGRREEEERDYEDDHGCNAEQNALEQVALLQLYNNHVTRAGLR